jgi:tRNA pseudouridine13 synthase
MLDRWLRDHLSAEQIMTIRLKTGELAMPRSMPDDVRPEWDALSLPLPSARLKFDPNAPWAGVIQAVMAEEGMPLERMRIRGLQRPFFSKGDRPVKISVSHLTWTASGDELSRGRQKLELHFELPRGSYATMVVKRLTT